MGRLLIVGAGGHGVVVADAAELSNSWSQIAFVDDAHPGRRKTLDWAIVGTVDKLSDLCEKFDSAVIAIGNNAVRMKILAVLDGAQMPIATIVHPSACVSRFAEIGTGTVLMANTAVNARTVIGRACIINTGASVDHDCQLADGVHIAPGVHLAAEVSVGNRTVVGVGSSVRPQVRIGCDVTVGAGSAVVQDVSESSVVAGIPAKPIQSASLIKAMPSDSL